MGTRLIKWLGDPPALDADNLWMIPDWRYENRRQIAMNGISTLIIEQSAIPGLSRSYTWDKDLPHYLLEVEAADALLILAEFPNRFRDVTDNAFPEHVRHLPILVKTDPKTGKKEVVTPNIARGEYRERVEVGKVDY